MTRGLFITLEGGEGTGKTTQAALLKSYLEDEGYEVVLTREPGGTKASEALRDVFVAHDGPKWPVEAQILLMFTARKIHVEQTIKPALERGAFVICDRFTDSTLAYQGYALGYDLEKFETLKEMVLGSFEPDLTFVFDIDPTEGLIRATGRDAQDDTFEKMDIGFHEKLRQAYLKIAEMNSERCLCVDATQEIDTISDTLARAVKERIQARH